MKILILFTSLFFLQTYGQSKNEPDWEELILSTGYTEKISDLTDYQLNYLKKIKSGFNKFMKKALERTQQEYNDYYQDSNPLEDIELTGLNLPEDKSDVWELYFENYGEDKKGNDKSLIVIIIFEGEDIYGTTFVN